MYDDMAGHQNAVTVEKQQQEHQQLKRMAVDSRLAALRHRYCLACKALFQPKQRRSWYCSRRCIERVSWHRKQARIAEAAARRRDHHQTVFGITNQLTLAELRRRWREEPHKNEARYRLWFPDLCGLLPEEALMERAKFQRECS